MRNKFKLPRKSRKFVKYALRLFKITLNYSFFISKVLFNTRPGFNTYLTTAALLLIVNYVNLLKTPWSLFITYISVFIVLIHPKWHYILFIVSVFELNSLVSLLNCCVLYTIVQCIIKIATSSTNTCSIVCLQFLKNSTQYLKDVGFCEQKS